MAYFDLIFILLGLLIIGSGILATRYYQRRYEERMEGPAANDVYNATNYNMQSIDPARLEKLSAEEARQLIEEMKAKGQIPAPRDFARLRRIIEQEQP